MAPATNDAETARRRLHASKPTPCTSRIDKQSEEAHGHDRPVPGALQTQAASGVVAGIASRPRAAARCKTQYRPRRVAATGLPFARKLPEDRAGWTARTSPDRTVPIPSGSSGGVWSIASCLSGYTARGFVPALPRPELGVAANESASSRMRYRAFLVYSLCGIFIVYREVSRIFQVWR